MASLGPGDGDPVRVRTCNKPLDLRGGRFNIVQLEFADSLLAGKWSARNYVQTGQGICDNHHGPNGSLAVTIGAWKMASAMRCRAVDQFRLTNFYWASSYHPVGEEISFTRRLKMRCRWRLRAAACAVDISKEGKES